MLTELEKHATRIQNEKDNQLKMIKQNIDRIEIKASKALKILIDDTATNNLILISALSQIQGLCSSTKKYWLPELYQKDLKELNEQHQEKKL